jgi:hypothetical protein
MSYLKLSAAGCGKSSIIEKNKTFYARLPRGKPQEMQARADST